MPIHDQGYQRYRGHRIAGGRSWWVIARAGILAKVRERRFLALLVFAWAPFLVRAVLMYAATTYTQASFLAPTPSTFHDFLDQQGIFVFFITIFAGAGLIANDRRANALQIYLSKPLTRTEYIVGKLATLLTFLVAVTWIPAMLLLFLQMMFSGSLAFVRANLFLIPAITVYAAAQVLVSALVVLALSSLSKTPRFVGMMYAGAVFFTAAMFRALREMTGSGSWVFISPQDTLDIIAAGVFRLPPPATLPLPVAAGVIGALLALAVWVIARRVRGVEVVA